MSKSKKRQAAAERRAAKAAQPVPDNRISYAQMLDLTARAKLNALSYG